MKENGITRATGSCRADGSMRFLLCGSGSKGNCFLLQDERVSLMIDCGGTKNRIMAGLNELGIGPDDLDAVLITHDHTDHIAQLKTVQHRPLYSACRLSGVSRTEIVPEVPFQIGHLTITPIALSHDVPDTVGFVIESINGKLVYITDTGYIRAAALPLLKGADYIILESNHDTEMLMKTSRPVFLKMRIAGDSGHLCNEDCAAVLRKIVTVNTKLVVLAHISQQANTREKALAVSGRALETLGSRRSDLILCAAAQDELLRGGDWPNEKVDGGSCSRTFDLECVADSANQ